MGLAEDIEAAGSIANPLARARDYERILQYQSMHPDIEFFLKACVGFSYHQDGALEQAIIWYDKAFSAMLPQRLKPVVLQNKGAALLGLRNRWGAQRIISDASFYAKQQGMYAMASEIDATLRIIRRLSDLENIEISFTYDTSPL